MPISNNNSRIDDLLVKAGFIETRFNVKIGNQPTNPPRAGATWSNATGAWAFTGGASQVTAPMQSRLICIMSSPASVPGTSGANYRLDGTATNNLPPASRVISAVIAGVTIAEAIDLSQKIDGPSLTQAVGSTTADVVGKVTYAGSTSGVTDVYIYLAHQ
jgi:hypothetical protein